MLVLIFGAIVCFTTGTLINDVGECGYLTKMYNLNSGDLMKVQSPKFPKSLTSPQSSTNISCSMTFKRTDQKNNGLQFIFTNGYTAGFLFNTPNGLMNPKKIGKQNHADDSSTYNFYDSNWNIQLLNAKNEQSLTYSYGMNSGGFEWSAFEAFVYAPEDNEQSNGCWMNGKTIDLVDDSKTIPLFFEQNPSNLQNCSWTINVPDGMAMKMTIPKYQLPDLNSQIRVYPDGGDFISLGEGISQIFNGKYFVIQLLTSGAFMKFEDGFLAFYALVSAVYQIPPVTTEFQCTKTTNFDKSDTIKFFDPQNGYPNSGICKMPLSSPPKTALIFEPQSRYMEYLGEWLQIHDAQDQILGDIMTSSVYSGENVDNWNLQFVTDENINGAGFNIQTFPIDCECAPNEFMVNCREQRFIPIMTGDTSSLTQTYTYCRGMNCSYKILPNNDCIDKNVEIDIKWKSFPDKYFDDSVVLNIDGNEVWNNTVSNVFSGTFDQGNLIEITLESEAYEFGFFSQPPTLVVAVTAVSRNTTIATTPSPTTCSRNAIQSIDKSQCFLVIRGNKTFIEAEADCKTYGGHLASIHNAFDNVIINDYARNFLGVSTTFLIGANDLTVEGVWNWIDGTPFDYDDFRHSHSSEFQDCAVVETQHGMWQQVDCYMGTNYACAIPQYYDKKESVIKTFCRKIGFCF